MRIQQVATFEQQIARLELAQGAWKEEKATSGAALGCLNFNSEQAIRQVIVTAAVNPESQRRKISQLMELQLETDLVESVITAEIVETKRRMEGPVAFAVVFSGCNSITHCPVLVLRFRIFLSLFPPLIAAVERSIEL